MSAADTPAVTASPASPETDRTECRQQLAAIKKECTLVILPDVLWTELKRNAEACGLPLRSFVKELLESEAASLRLPNIRIEGEREPTGAHLPGTPKDDGFYPDPEMCYHVRLHSGPVPGAE